MAVRAHVEPAMLRWGRETAGLAVADVARAIHVSEERITGWESPGGDHPTITQLRALADRYKRPLNLFFLPAPPEEHHPHLHDFRRIDAGVAGRLSPALIFQIRRIQERRDIALELKRELEEEVPAFDFNCNQKEDPEEVGRRLRQFLGIDINEQKTWRRAYQPLTNWRARIEAKGVLACQISGVKVSEARGFSVCEVRLPAIACNSKDSPNARVFTLAHELTHVGLRTSGICDIDEERARRPSDQSVETFCNAVAGATLLPISDLIDDDLVGSRRGEWSDGELEELGKRFGVSKFVVLRRLLTAQRIASDFYRLKHRQWLAHISAGDSGPVPPYRRAVAEAGKEYVRLVLRAYESRSINLSDVSQYLGIRLKHLRNLEDAAYN